MISLIIISGPWPEADNIVLPELPFIPQVGEEFTLSSNHYKKQAKLISKITGITGQKCRVVSVSHQLLCHMQEIRIYLYCGKAIAIIPSN